MTINILDVTMHATTMTPAAKRKQMNDDKDSNDDDKEEDGIETPKKTVNKNAFALLMASSSAKSDSKMKTGTSSGNSSSGKKRPRSSLFEKQQQEMQPQSKFVLCPAGCGRHILPHLINDHLDKCFDRMREGGTGPADDNTGNDDGNNQNNGEDGKDSTKTSARPVSDHVQASPTPVKNNVFNRMMQQSAQGFPTMSKNGKGLVQRMHLHDDMRVSVTCYSSDPNATQLEDDYLGRIAWSATVQVRIGSSNSINPNGSPTAAPVQLIISSSIPSGSNTTTSSIGDGGPNHQRHRWVQRHSRLSVPVLKSILQKSVRRRKPLPSVRVAMELADKSLSDLLRRIVVIAVEDSTVHPDIPLMVWLMIATSKDFDLSCCSNTLQLSPPSQPSYTTVSTTTTATTTTLELWKRIFIFIFEMASCRWKDPLQPIDLGGRKKTDNDRTTLELECSIASVTSIASFHNKTSTASGEERSKLPNETEKPHRLSLNDTLIWSILMRSHYGGMKGDISMLQDAAKLWNDRFRADEGNLQDFVVDRLLKSMSTGGDKSTNEISKWSQVPTFIHSAASKISLERINSLLNCHPQSQRHFHRQTWPRGLTCLTFGDITTEGVDFHCSNILESTVLKDTTFVMECCDKLKGAALPLTVPTIPESISARRSWLEAVAKNMIWNYSAGVNFRQTLYVLGDVEGKDPSENPIDADKTMKEFFDARIRPRTKAFSESYVKNRLAK